MVLPLQFEPPSRLLILVGNYGSGKTEVSVNLAIHLARSNAVRIVDLDIVNPYFRCREAREEMESLGIHVLYPKGEFHSADLPILLPEVKGTLYAEEGYTLFDVGGDDMGARILSSLADLIASRDYAMLQVINACRPFTSDVKGCMKIKEEIESASRLQVTGFVANAHLMEETTKSTILNGIGLAREVGRASGLEVAFATVPKELTGQVSSQEAGCPLLAVVRRMLPPWRLKSMTDRAGRILKSDGGG